MKSIALIYSGIVFWVLFSWSAVPGQDPEQPVNVYLDCDRCDMSYLKRKADWVNYVRDQKDADVHIWELDQHNGGGGTKFLFRFIGLKKHENINFEIEKHISSSSTSLELQDIIIKVMSNGLKPFLINKTGEGYISGAGEDNTAPRRKESRDKWNNWVFEVAADVEYEQESSRNDMELGGGIEANRTTEEWRIRTEFDMDYERNRISRDDKLIISTLNRWEFEGSVVKSLTGQLSGGIFIDIWNNSVENIKLGLRLNAALEYNFYPYDQSHTREFTIAYMIGYRYMNYYEETIFGFNAERLNSQRISMEYNIRKTWGNIKIEMDGFHYLHDIRKNRFSLEAGTDIRIIKGLFFRISGEYQLIHDQIYLPKGNASLEDVLLKRQALATDHSAELELGLVYTFGALFNNIVNTRL